MNVERMTYWSDDGKGGGEWRANVRGMEVLGAEIDRLAAYEDIGPIDRLRELVQAEQDGRLVVLPCKVGDTVYIITKCSCEDIDGLYTECEFYGVGTDDRICVIPNGVKCPHQYRVVEYGVTGMNLIDFTKNFGKTVFLTRKDAEAALTQKQAIGG